MARFIYASLRGTYGILSVNMNIAEMGNLERWVAFRDPSLGVGLGCFGKRYLVRDNMGRLTEAKESIAELRGGIVEWRDVSQDLREHRALLSNDSVTYIIVFNLLHIYVWVIRY